MLTLPKIIIVNFMRFSVIHVQIFEVMLSFEEGLCGVSLSSSMHIYIYLCAKIYSGGYRLSRPRIDTWPNSFEGMRCNLGFL